MKTAKTTATRLPRRKRNLDKNIIYLGEKPKGRRRTKPLWLAHRLDESDPGFTVFHRKVTGSFNQLTGPKIRKRSQDEVNLLKELSKYRRFLLSYNDAYPEIQYERLRFMGKLIDLEIGRGDLKVAQQHAYEMLRVSQIYPGEAYWQHALLASLSALGPLAHKQCNGTEAAYFFSYAQDLARQLVADEPDNAAWQRELAISEFNAATFELAQGSDYEGYPELESCFKVLDGMVDRKLPLGKVLIQLYQELQVALEERSPPYELELLAFWSESREATRLAYVGDMS